jgi:hypothetical protein
LLVKDKIFFILISYLDCKIDKLTHFFLIVFSFILLYLINLELSFIIFSVCYQSHYPSYEFDVLTRVNSDCFFNLFLIDSFFFQFHHSILNWLGIEIHNLFQFTFYGVILVTWPKLQVWKVNIGLLKLFFFLSFLINFSFHFILQHWVL